MAILPIVGENGMLCGCRIVVITYDGVCSAVIGSGEFRRRVPRSRILGRVDCADIRAPVVGRNGETLADGIDETPCRYAIASQ